MQLSHNNCCSLVPRNLSFFLMAVPHSLVDLLCFWHWPSVPVSAHRHRFPHNCIILLLTPTNLGSRRGQQPFSWQGPSTCSQVYATHLNSFQAKLKTTFFKINYFYPTMFRLCAWVIHMRMSTLWVFSHACAGKKEKSESLYMIRFVSLVCETLWSYLLEKCYINIHYYY